MLRITVELVPGGNEAQKRTIGVAHIINKGIAKTHSGEDVFHYSVIEMAESGQLQWHSVAKRYPNVFRFIENLYKLKE
jgi:hypothetical protein